jgi:F0F1-type ATP synthase assembly protein I
MIGFFLVASCLRGLETFSFRDFVFSWLYVRVMPSFRKSDAGMMRTAWELSAGMLSFVVAIALGWWFGSVLDDWLGTSPWLTAVFSCLGLVAGVLNVYRTVRRAMLPVAPVQRSGREAGPPR